MKASLKILRSVIGVIVAVLVWFGMESSIALRRAGSIGWEIVKKKKKNYSIVAHRVTTWDEDTTKLIADKSFPDLIMMWEWKAFDAIAPVIQHLLSK